MVRNFNDGESTQQIIADSKTWKRNENLVRHQLYFWKQEWFSKKKDRTDVGVGWLVRPPREKKSLPVFS